MAISIIYQNDDVTFLLEWKKRLKINLNFFSFSLSLFKMCVFLVFKVEFFSCADDGSQFFLCFSKDYFSSSFQKVFFFVFFSHLFGGRAIFQTMDFHSYV